MSVRFVVPVARTQDWELSGWLSSYDTLAFSSPQGGSENQFWVFCSWEAAMHMTMRLLGSSRISHHDHIICFSIFPYGSDPDITPMSPMQYYVSIRIIGGMSLKMEDWLPQSRRHNDITDHVVVCPPINAVNSAVTTRSPLCHLSTIFAVCGHVTAGSSV